MQFLLKEIKQGIIRNKKTSLSIILLTFITFSLLSSVFYVKDIFTQTQQYMNDQMNIRVLVDDETQINKLKDKIKESKIAEHINVLSKEQLKEEMTDENTSNIYETNDFPAAITFKTISDKEEGIERLVEELNMHEEVRTVIYPKEMAEKIVNTTEKIEKTIKTITFIGVITTIFIISIGMHLSISNREKEIKIKLLLGAKPVRIKSQFYLESIILSLIGAIFSFFCTLLMNNAYLSFTETLLFLEKNEKLFLHTTGFVLLSAVIIALVGAYLPVKNYTNEK